jgi:two-component system chemotaxis response regulator CheY
MALVLVVDDSQYARRVHGRILQSGGHEVIEAGTGAEAIEAFAVRKPDLVVLDLTMADISGVDVLTKVLELDREARVLIVSADVQRTTETLVMESGAIAFLGKPVEPERLLEAVTQALATQ